MIAFFGGSFDPIHNGHLILAHDIKEMFGFEKIIFMPAYISPLKRVHFATPEDRVEMLKKAIDDVHYFDIDTWEIEKGGVSYTVDTLKYIRDKYGEKPYIILGADSLLNFKNWKDPESVIENSYIVGIERNGKLEKVREYFSNYFCRFKEGKDYFLVNTRRVDISSTEIRRRVREGKSIRGMVPSEVESYIMEKGIYKD